eukprot:TRINITY_DN12282_c0_g1_i1.p2 TRINITY_DN12282_c0_g1~~TRINITY_DN12282_c0_g1_i1.p2  ORF type:complete len:130 (+),score=39.59 TRINITY_DN12282_c0_g1_i1:346-735(+)
MKKEREEREKQAKRDQKKAGKENKLKGPPTRSQPADSGEWSGFCEVKTWNSAATPDARAPLQDRKRPSYSERDVWQPKRQKSESPPDRPAAFAPTPVSSRKAAQKAASETPLGQTKIAKRVKPLNKKLI